MKELILDGVDLSPIFVDIYCDPSLQLITKYHHTKAMVNKGCFFGFLFDCLLFDFPEITKRYPPGSLGFTLNGQPPEPFTPLKNGDKICLMAGPGLMARAMLH